MKRLLLLAAAPTLVLVGTLAQAQAPINQPTPLGPRSTVVVPANPPVQQAPVVVAPQPPTVVAPPQPGAAVVNPPAGQNTAIVVPEGSTVTVFNNGVRQDFKKYSVQGNVRTFDSWSGRMTLQDGTVLLFPSNFAFSQVPSAGQPVKVTYFTDQNGNNIAQSIDSGTIGTAGR
jgi:hypothetical protein